MVTLRISTLQWRHNGSGGVSNHRRHVCLLNRLLRRRSKETSKLRVTGLYEGNSPVTGEFPAQRASNAENVSIWWRHHEISSDHNINSLLHGASYRQPHKWSFQKSLLKSCDVWKNYLYGPRSRHFDEIFLSGVTESSGAASGENFVKMTKF